MTERLTLLAAWLLLCGLVAWSGAQTRALVADSEQLSQDLQARTTDQLCQSLLNDWELLEAMRTNGWKVAGIQGEVKGYRDYYCTGWVQPNLRGGVS
jgi:hypothetical protein